MAQTGAMIYETYRSRRGQTISPAEGVSGLKRVFTCELLNADDRAELVIQNPALIHDDSPIKSVQIGDFFPFDPHNNVAISITNVEVDGWMPWQQQVRVDYGVPDVSTPPGQVLYRNWNVEVDFSNIPETVVADLDGKMIGAGVYEIVKPGDPSTHSAFGRSVLLREIPNALRPEPAQRPRATTAYRLTRTVDGLFPAVQGGRGGIGNMRNKVNARAFLRHPARTVRFEGAKFRYEQEIATGGETRSAPLGGPVWKTHVSLFFLHDATGFDEIRIDRFEDAGRGIVSAVEANTPNPEADDSLVRRSFRLYDEDDFEAILSAFG